MIKNHLLDAARFIHRLALIPHWLPGARGVSRLFRGGKAAPHLHHIVGGGLMEVAHHLRTDVLGDQLPVQLKHMAHVSGVLEVALKVRHHLPGQVIQQAGVGAVAMSSKSISV